MSQTINYVVLYTFVCIVASILAREINKRVPLIPYTPLLICFGFTIGSLKWWGNLNDGADNVSLINPHGILTILLPVLIFESSYNAKLQILKENLLQVLLLAIPGVILTAILLSFSLKVILGYDDNSLTWAEALTLGCILGTTDPVAVVALLKELGAPLRTNTLIEMESLLNDGVAMVFFTIFLESSKGAEISPAEGIGMFFQLAFGGPILGLLFGLASYLVTLMVVKDKTLFMTIILLSAYGVFFVAEKLELGVSGLLALVALGFFQSIFLKNQMTQEQEHTIHSILGYIQVLDESFLFFLAGTIIGNQLVNTFIKNLEPNDFLNMFFFYILLILVRFIVVFFFAFIVKMCGQTIKLKEALLQTWGGLRGALSLALALVVFQDDQLPERPRTLILFHTAALAALTLIVNGSTASYLVKKTNVVENIDERESYQEIFQREIRSNAIAFIQEQKQKDTLALTYWDGVVNLMKFTKTNETIIIKNLSISSQRYRCLRVLINTLHQQQHEQYFSKSIFNAVMESAEVSCERCYQPIDIFTHTEGSLVSLEILTQYKKLSHKSIIGNFFNMILLFQLDENFQVLSLLINVLSSTVESIQDIVQDQDLIIKITEEMQSNMQKCLDLMLKYKSRFTNEIQKISQRQAAMKVLVSQIQYVDDYKGSFITKNEGMELKRFLFARLDQTKSLKILVEMDSGPEYLLEASFRGYLNEKEIYQICQNYEHRSIREGHYLIDINQPEQYCYLIMEGIIEEEIEALGFDEPKLIQYSSGNIVGIPNVIDHKVESIIRLKAITDCQFLAIPIQMMREMFTQNQKFEAYCYKEALSTFLVMYHSQKHHFNKFIHIQLYDWAMKAKLVKVTGDPELFHEELILPQCGAFIFQGNWISLDGQFEFKQWDFIESMKIQLKPLTKGIALILSNKLKLDKQSIEEDVKSSESKQLEESMLLEHPGLHH